MAYMQSPGVQVKEFDISSYIPGVSMSVAAIGGVYSWGPAFERTLISDEDLLVNRFGRPNDDNYETFLISSNFLAYSNALYVSRAVDANTFNAYAGVSNTNIQINNLNDFTVKQDAIENTVTFIAKYPSALGNSLKVSVCASEQAFSSDIELVDANTSMLLTVLPGATSATLVVTSTDDADAAEVELDGMLNNLVQGDFIRLTTPSAGVQYVKYNSSTPIVKNNTDKTATTTLNLGSRYTLIEPVSMTTLSRAWEYFNLFDRAPGTSNFTAARGGSGDELHIVVVDVDGVFTGQPNDVIEIYNAISRATDAKTENGTAAYYKDVIKDSSQYLWALGDPSGITSGPASSMTPLTVPQYTATLANGTNSASESTISLAALSSAYDQFKSKEDVDVSIIISGKANGGTRGEGLANYIIDNIAEVRKDCVVTISPALGDIVNNPFFEVDNLIAFRRLLRYSGRGFFTTSYKYQFDRYNNKYRWVAGCGDDAGLMARTDFERDPWWSPAGQNRGVYKNIIKLAFNPNQTQRDALYKEDINPVVNQVGSGVILYGDKTLLGKPSAFDRINVRRLFDTLEKAIEKYARTLLFEFNDIYTRARFRNMVDPYLRDVLGRRGITRYQIVCDERNNTPVVIDRNEFVGSIYIVPAKSINFITLNFVAVANTVSFDYAIGEVDGQPI